MDLGPLFWGLVPVFLLAALAVVLVEGRSFWMSRADVATGSRAPTLVVIGAYLLLKTR